MATGRTFEAVPIGEPVQEDDIEFAFNEWVNGLKDSESPGYVRAFRVPLDEQGKPSYSATGQVRLGSWPIDQYDFDGLCSKILKEYMLPTETMMAVRLMGTIKGKGGASFNKIVMLQKPNPTNVLPAAPGSQAGGLGDVLTTMQQGQERMMRLFQEMSGPKTTGDSNSEMMKLAAMMRVMMEPMTTMMGPILAAVAGRPASLPGQSTSLRETIETMMLLDKYAGKRGGDGASRSGFAEIATAVSNVAKPVLEMAAATMQQNMRNRDRVAQSPPQPQLTRPQSTPAVPVTPQPQITPSHVVIPPTGVDLSKPSSAQISPFAPGADTDAPSNMMVGDSHMFVEIKKQVDALVIVAQQGSDATAVADQFFDDVLMGLDDRSYGRLCTALESNHYLDTLAAYNPQVKQHSDWFARLRSRLVEHILAADNPTSRENDS